MTKKEIMQAVEGLRKKSNGTYFPDGENCGTCPAGLCAPAGRLERIPGNGDPRRRLGLAET